VPAVRFEALRRIVGEPAIDFAVDRNAVAVVKADQLVEAQGPGQGAGFVRYALHQAAVADKDIGPVIDNDVARAIELRCKELFGERHAHCVGESLAQRSCRRFDSRRYTALGMTGRHRLELSKALDLFHRQGVAAQVEERILKHRPVAVREDEAIAVRPSRVGRIVAQMPVPQRDCDLGHAHRHARVSGIGCLHRIHRQGANSIGKQDCVRREPSRCQRRRGGNGKRCSHGLKGRLKETEINDAKRCCKAVKLSPKPPFWAIIASLTDHSPAIDSQSAKWDLGEPEWTAFTCSENGTVARPRCRK
jgi:hypothetical protein